MPPGHPIIAGRSIEVSSTAASGGIGPDGLAQGGGLSRGGSGASQRGRPSRGGPPSQPSSPGFEVHIDPGKVVEGYEVPLDPLVAWATPGVEWWMTNEERAEARASAVLHTTEDEVDEATAGGVAVGEVDGAADAALRAESAADEPTSAEVAPASSTESEQTALKSLVSALGNEEGRAELKALFATLDKDGDGKVTSKEWGSSLSKNKELMGKYFGGSSMQEIGKAFKRLDLNGDGELDWEEFLHGAEVQAASLGVDFAPIRGADAALQRRPAADESEQTALKSLVSALGSEEGRAELKALFATLDKDGDGKVTSKEWGSSLSKNKELMGKYFGGSSMQEIGKAFKRLDSNGDGELDWEEFLHGAEVQAASLGVDFAPIRGADAALQSRPAADESEQAALKSLVSALGSEEGRAELKALFATLDKDGDGKVTSKEWGSSLSKNKELMGKYFGGSSMQEIGKAFKRLAERRRRARLGGVLARGGGAGGEPWRRLRTDQRARGAA